MSDEPVPPHHRTVKSFVLREGRMTSGQKLAMEEMFPIMGVDFKNQILDFPTLFGREAPTILEIGFGMGNSLVEQATKNPDKNYLGIEVHGPGIGACLLLAQKAEITNLRVIKHDAVEVLKNGMVNNSLTGVQIYFPDPWHKTKHHKRRIIQTKFVDLLSEKLSVEGFIHLATDWQNYASHMLKVMTAHEDFRNQSESKDYIVRPQSRPLTKFEQRGERLGHGVWDLMFEKIK